MGSICELELGWFRLYFLTEEIDFFAEIKNGWTNTTGK